MYLRHLQEYFLVLSHCNLIAVHISFSVGFFCKILSGVLLGLKGCIDFLFALTLLAYILLMCLQEFCLFKLFAICGHWGVLKVTNIWMMEGEAIMRGEGEAILRDEFLGIWVNCFITFFTTNLKFSLKVEIGH